MIYALHGFLGNPSDWETVFQGNRWGHDLCAPDLFKSQSVPSLEACAQEFNQKVAKDSGPHILIGYSLGGRLAMHALTQQPALWKAAIIISAHPGLDDEEKKKERFMLDEQWAHRFEKEPWEDLMQAWNGREVFQAGGFNFNRLEKDYQRSILADVLRKWSLGGQTNFRAQLAQLEVPVLWMVGADDAIYVQQANKIFLKHPLSKISLVSGAGHRMPWQKREEFLLQITQFLTQIP